MAPTGWQAACDMVSAAASVARRAITAAGGEDTDAQYRAVADALREHSRWDCAIHEPVPNRQAWSTGGPPYLVASLPRRSEAGAKTTDIIVDLSFGERFSLSRSTPAYDRSLSSSAVFVGSVTQLWVKIEDLSREIERAFCLHSMEVPPWRTMHGMRLTYAYSDPVLVAHKPVLDTDLILPGAGVADPVVP
eukprot:TRINITY_DN958_c11_g1_i1.p1 TRINITY_DN958_c11_g1~~TRINITY_DN958_c11_g1_i1.p1  ORF type:complete len:191 (+),score=53.69 TRINITY_DN958_c11_g1_i1:153-725(+)